MHRRLRACLLLAFACSLSCTRPGPLPAAPEKSHPLEQPPAVKVRIFRQFSLAYVQVDIDSGLMTLTADDQTPLELPANTRRLTVSRKDGQLLCNAHPVGTAAPAPFAFSSLRIQSISGAVVWFKITIPELGIHRDYEGTCLDISQKYGNLALIEVLPLELYLARVLPAEMDPDHFTAEVLKAQAVVARTWALKNLKRHQRYGYNFCDSTHCQAYRGRRIVSRRAEKAVAQTLGEVITYQGRLAEAFYHSTCGGNTVFIRDVWGVPAVPYLSRVEDYWKTGNRPYCIHSPFARWTASIPLLRLQHQLRVEKILGAEEKLQDIKVEFVNLSGRVKRLLLVTDLRQRGMDVDDFRRIVNERYDRPRLISRFFEISHDRQTILISGKGLGHGVGLCQWGARGMAQHGFGYRQILLHYFKDTQISPAYGQTEPVPPQADSQP